MPLEDRDEGKELGGQAGLGVDRFGGPIVDPTKNVLDLVRAGRDADAILRQTVEHFQDKLEDLERRRTDERFVAEKDRMNGTIEAESRRIDGLAVQKAVHEKQIFDILAYQVKTTSDLISGQLDKITTLLQGQINSTAASLNAQITTERISANDRMSKLEQFRYESGGKQSVADPATSEALHSMSAAITSMRDYISTNQGSDQRAEKSRNETHLTIGSVVGVVGGCVGALGLLVAILIGVSNYAQTSRAPLTVNQTAPQEPGK